MLVHICKTIGNKNKFTTKYQWSLLINIHSAIRVNTEGTVINHDLIYEYIKIAPEYPQYTSDLVSVCWLVLLVKRVTFKQSFLKGKHKMTVHHFVQAKICPRIGFQYKPGYLCDCFVLSHNGHSRIVAHVIRDVTICYTDRIWQNIVYFNA